MAFPWCTKAGGMALAFPDVCKIPAPPAPPIPVPFPNIAQLAQATKTSKKVKVINQPVVTIASEIGKTQGDEAGTLKGVSSSTNMDKAVFKKGAGKVKVEGNAPVLMLGSTAQNGASANAPGGAVLAPSQAKVLSSP